MTRIALALALLASPLAADEDRFVASNTFATFYHELAHALVDLRDIPIFGQEEDAADVFSAIMISETWEEERAVAMAYDTAFGFTTDPEDVDLEETYFWGVHGPDPQRYYNFVCIFFGGNPEEREDVALELGLPEERMETCGEEFDLAMRSWGGVLEAMAASGDAGRLTLEGDDAEQRAILAEEVDWLNDQYGFPVDIPVKLEPCGEDNAFYDPEERAITMCSESIPYLRTLWREVPL